MTVQSIFVGLSCEPWGFFNLCHQLHYITFNFFYYQECNLSAEPKISDLRLILLTNYLSTPGKLPTCPGLVMSRFAILMWGEACSILSLPLMYMHWVDMGGVAYFCTAAGQLPWTLETYHIVPNFFEGQNFHRLAFYQISQANFTDLGLWFAVLMQPLCAQLHVYW